MSFEFRDARLCVEDVPLPAVAERYGTPCYVYSRAQIEARFQAYRDAFASRRHQICYSVKANGNLAVLDILGRMGAAFDIVSGGELERVRAAGAPLDSVRFAGVGKTRAEIALAVEAGIACFNVESRAELDLIAAVCKDLTREATIAIRVNPDVDAATHPYIATGLNENKFGIAIDDAMAVYQQAARTPGIQVSGIACHIGSQLTSLGPVTDAVARVMHFLGALQDHDIDIAHIDIGGGLGVAYGTDTPPSIAEYVAAICAGIAPRYEIIVEPGRSIVGAAGVLLTAVQSIKHTPKKTFAICDAAMNDLLRPALYDAYHEIKSVTPNDGEKYRVDVVGPVCESADCLARDRELTLSDGALLAVMDCGAYGFVMASNYNGRPRPAEVLIDGSAMHLIRERETVAGLYHGEHCLPPD